MALLKLHGISNEDLINLKLCHGEDKEYWSEKANPQLHTNNKAKDLS